MVVENFLTMIEDKVEHLNIAVVNKVTNGGKNNRVAQHFERNIHIMIRPCKQAKLEFKSKYGIGDW